MLFLLSPAKSLDYETRVSAPLQRKATEPLFVPQAAELIDILRRKTPAQVATLMDLSDKLAQLNVARYAVWQPEATRDNSKPAVLAFDGDVYDGLQAKSLKTADLGWAQEHLVILSGLYGALRPLDRLQPYRLEMGTALKNPRGKDLYAFWGETVAQYLNERQAEEASPVVVNLASIEYARVVPRAALRARVVDCVFQEGQGSEARIVSFFAKKARGMMARFAVENRVRSLRRLQDFEAGGYAFDRAASTPSQLVFRRAEAHAATEAARE